MGDDRARELLDALLERGETEGCLELSDIEASIEAIGLDEDEIPALLDTVDNRTERAYTGWPDRLYVIGTDGKVKFKTAPGPFGFHPKPMEESLRQQLDLSPRASIR